MGHADIATAQKYLHYVERPDEAELVPAGLRRRVAGIGPAAPTSDAGRT